MPSFDSSPVTYWVPVYLLCWLLAWATLTNKLRSSWLFLGLSFLLLFLLRLASIVYDQEINPDESQMIAQALTLRYDPVFWRSVDGTTGGPLNTYLLTWVGLLGLPFDYITAHLVAYALVTVILLLTYKTASYWFGETPARWALLPFVLMLGLTQNADLLHYNSELIGVALLSGAGYLYARILNESMPSLWRFGVIGLALGFVPFSKLQGLPLAATVGMFVGIDLLTRRQLSGGAKWARLGVLVASGCATVSGLIGLIALNGVFDSFMTFYLKANFGYGDSPSIGSQLKSLPAYLHNVDELLAVIVLTGVVWLAVLVRKIALPEDRMGSQLTWKIGSFLVFMVAVGLYAVLRTGMNFIHYLFFIFNPLLLLLAYGWRTLLADKRTLTLVWRSQAVATALLLVLFCFPTIANQLQGKPINLYMSDKQGGWKMPLSPVAKAVLKYAFPGEKLVVWGWMCSYYVETRMPQGVAENHSQRSVFFTPMLKEYQHRYLANVLQSFPPVFVDAVGNHNLWMTDRKTQGHEFIKPLGRFVAAHYKYMGLVSDARIYVRLDRIEGRSCTLPQPSTLAAKSPSGATAVLIH